MSRKQSLFSFYRDALVKHLAASVDVKQVKSHPGQFTAEDVKKLIVTAPALYVAVMAVRPAEAESEANLNTVLRLTVFMVTRDLPNYDRDAQALDLAWNIMACLDRWQPKKNDVFMAKPAKSFSWSSGYAVDGSGTLISALSFDAGLTLVSQAVPDDVIADPFNLVFHDGVPVEGDPSGLDI